MAKVKLRCGVYGEGSVFSVHIERDGDVEALQEAIFYKKRYNHQYKFDSSTLTLYLARKGGAWLADDANLDALLRGDVDKDLTKMRSSWKLTKAELLGPDFTPREEEIHVLVELPPSAGVAPTQQSGLWLVRGSIANALSTKGARSRLYRLAGPFLGYYDPARRTGDRNNAFWYEDETLCIHVLFKTEDYALQFENALRDERLTIGSPLNALVVMTRVDQVPGLPDLLQRIFYEHYEPQETDSPQDVMSSFSASTSIIDTMTDEFKYQRIESDAWFGPVGKAQSCHVMSHEQCKSHVSYRKYDRDKSNRLALSPEMHSWYDALTCAVPVFNICVESVSQHPVINNRYEVKLLVRALDAHYGRLISMRLKEGAIVSTDLLEMRTSVHVENPKVFCTCMDWKNKQIQKLWQDYYSMTSAAD